MYSVLFTDRRKSTCIAGAHRATKASVERCNSKALARHRCNENPRHVDCRFLSDLNRICETFEDFSGVLYLCATAQVCASCHIVKCDNLPWLWTCGVQYTPNHICALLGQHQIGIPHPRYIGLGWDRGSWVGHIDQHTRRQARSQVGSWSRTMRV